MRPLLSALQLKHLGFFRLPAGPQRFEAALPEELKKYARFGYGGRAMCLSTDRRSLWVSGHQVGDLVAKVAIPGIGAEAILLLPFFEIVPRDILAAARVDQLVGLNEVES